MWVLLAIVIVALVLLGLTARRSSRHGGYMPLDEATRETEKKHGGREGLA